MEIGSPCGCLYCCMYLGAPEAVRTQVLAQVCLEFVHTEDSDRPLDRHLADDRVQGQWAACVEEEGARPFPVVHYSWAYLVHCQQLCARWWDLAEPAVLCQDCRQEWVTMWGNFHSLPEYHQGKLGVDLCCPLHS